MSFPILSVVSFSKSNLQLRSLSNSQITFALRSLSTQKSHRFVNAAYSHKQKHLILQHLNSKVPKSPSKTFQISGHPIGLFLNQSTHQLLSARLFSNQNRIDPTAKRPTSVCDPYGQGGKPLDYEEAYRLLSTLDTGWNIETETSHEENDTSDNAISIYREFYHSDFMRGSQFLSHVAAVGHMNNHFPHLTLERRLLKKEKAWCVVTTVKCTTPPLNGLSYNDFHVAMLIDVEVARENVKKLIVVDNKKLKKSI